MKIKINSNVRDVDIDYLDGESLVIDTNSHDDGIYAFAKVRDSATPNDARVARGRTFLIIDRNLVDNSAGTTIEAFIVHDGEMMLYSYSPIRIDGDDLFEKVDGTLTLEVNL